MSKTTNPYTTDPYWKSRTAIIDLLEKWSGELINKRLNDPVAVRIAAEMEEVIKTERISYPKVERS